MKYAVISLIESVKVENGKTVVSVSLNGMRSDLSDNIEIYPSEIKQWYGVDAKGNSIKHELKPGVTIFYKNLHTATRRLEGVSFTDEDKE